MAKKTHSKLFRWRVALASIVFPLITLLFLDFTGTLHTYLGWLAKIQLLPAVLALNVVVIVALLLLTLIFGRIYCSVICPMGVFQDVVSAAHDKRKKNRFTYSKPLSWLRYSVFGVFVASVVGGINVVGALLAPYSSYGRMVSSLLQPVYIAGNNVLASMAECMDSYAFYEADVWLKSAPTLVVAILTFIIIAVLAWRGGRTYCNTICPVGTVLGLVARFSWLKVHIDEEKCVSCGLCTKNCKASAIDPKTHKIDYTRCVACGVCQGKCAKSALVYGHPKASSKPSGTPGDTPDTSRRSFLLAAAVATTSAALAQEKKKVDGGLAVIQDKQVPHRTTPITPPGSLSASHMAKHCTACQLCVSACPNGVLRPSASLGTFMQPTMSYERGYCRPECTKCGEVCPAGAIEPITRADKSATHIGHAVWIKKNCVPVTDGVQCGNCARHCPVGAIIMVPLDPKDESENALLVPAVDENVCIGCGACENLCPSRPLSAIYVEGHEQHREG